jgi:hypothetical protein
LRRQGGSPQELATRLTQLSWHYYWGPATRWSPGPGDHLARTKALDFDRQSSAGPQLPLAVLARIHLTFHVQGGGPALLPDLSSIVGELRKRRLVCHRLPPAMQRLLGGAPAPSMPPASSGTTGARGSGAGVHASPVARLQIGPGGNLVGSCIRTAAAAGNPLPLTNDGHRNFCLAYHYVGRGNLNCGGKATHPPLSRGAEQRLHAWKTKWVDPPVPRSPAPAPPPARPAPGAGTAFSASQPPGLPRIARPYPAANTPRPPPGGARSTRT